MKSSSPVDRNVALVSRQPSSTLCSRKRNAISTAPRAHTRPRGSPIDPPAEIEQYSNKPSNTGQSSPTLTARNQSAFPPPSQSRKAVKLTLAHLPSNPSRASSSSLCRRLDQIRRDARKEVYVFVRVELSHLLARCGLGALCGRGLVWALGRAPQKKTHEDLHLLVEAVVHHEGVGHPECTRVSG